MNFAILLTLLFPFKKFLVTIALSSILFSSSISLMPSASARLENSFSNVSSGTKRSLEAYV